MFDNPTSDGDALGAIADLLATRIAPALERIAAALERGGMPAGGTASDRRHESVTLLRRVIREGDLALAATLLDDFRLDHPDAAETESLADELAESSRAMVVDLSAKLAAARSAGDPMAVIGLRDSLAPRLDHVEAARLDSEILPWLMGLLMKRLRGGTVRPDVVELASRVAESFSHRSEGASLRASLSTLRRSAGLCARCSQPYTGVEDACPQCSSDSPRIAELPESPPLPT